LSLRLPWDPTSASAARRLVRRAFRELAPDALGDVVDLAVLLTSELASNAILHARTPFTVTVLRYDGVMRVSVRDGSRALPARRRYSLAASTGRGVALLQDCADRSGVESHLDGKTVWFEVGVEPAGAHAHEHVS
jgi:anti-sigma regulatory factor (Ser/Thr protein kinase)